jgi:hypothetical protein
MPAGSSRRSHRRWYRRRSDSGWRRFSWFGAVAVCLLLGVAIGLRLLSHMDQQPELAALEHGSGERLDGLPGKRLRKAFDELDLARMLLACRYALDLQTGEVLQPQAIAWRPGQIDFHVAHGSEGWRHYWCRGSGVGRGQGQARPPSVGGKYPLPLEELVYHHSAALADRKLRSLEVLGDGQGGADYRLRWADGLESGNRRELPPGNFPSLFEDAGTAPARTESASFEPSSAPP